MNWDQIQGKWREAKGSAKERWGKFTDDDLAFIDGSKDKLIGRLQERYGIGKEEAQRQLDEWVSTVSLGASEEHPSTERSGHREAPQARSAGRH
jgi:uncharacterized protein YjbJ (UPF0337 family)